MSVYIYIYLCILQNCLRLEVQGPSRSLFRKKPDKKISLRTTVSLSQPRGGRTVVKLKEDLTSALNPGEFISYKNYVRHRGKGDLRKCPAYAHARWTFSSLQVGQAGIGSCPLQQQLYFFVAV